MDYAALETLVKRHPGWQLLRHPDAPLAASFLGRVFIEANLDSMPREHLLDALEDELYALRRRFGKEAFPRSAAECLDAWAAAEIGWLHRHYATDSHDPQYELTPATAHALRWLAELADVKCTAIASGLQVLTDLLRQIRERADPDPARRIEALRKRREEIDAEMDRARAGNVAVLDPADLKEHLRQLVRLSDELLLDYRLLDDMLRSHEQHLRTSAAQVAPQTAETLTSALHDSEAARSLRMAWERLIANSEHEELSEAMAEVLALPAAAEVCLDERMRSAPYAWLAASERLRRKLAERTQQLERFARARSWQAQREIAELLQRIEARASAVPQALSGEAAIQVPAIVPAPPLAPAPDFVPEDIDESDIDADSVRDVLVDEAELPLARAALAGRIEQALQMRAEVSLREVIAAYPLQHGLAELLAYLALARTRDAARMEPDTIEPISWDLVEPDGLRVRREAALPRIVFRR